MNWRLPQRAICGAVFIAAAFTHVVPAGAQTPDHSADDTIESSDQAAAPRRIDYSCGPKLSVYRYYPTPADRDWWDGDGGILGEHAWLYGGLYDVWVGNAFDRIYWGWGEGLIGGDVVSFRWSDDYGATYHDCRTTVGSGNTSATTWGVNQWGGRSFQTCVYTEYWVCTNWNHNLP